MTIKVIDVRVRAACERPGGWKPPPVQLTEVGGWDIGRPDVAFASLTEALLSLASSALSTVWLHETLCVVVDGEAQRLESGLVLHTTSTGHVTVDILCPGVRGDSRGFELTRSVDAELPRDLTIGSDLPPLDIRIRLDQEDADDR